jgi:4-oxalocrotonate tautomerase family enzyme
MPTSNGREGEPSMPLVKVYLDKGSKNAEQRADIARKITDLIVKETGMPQHYTWVMVHEIPEEDWIVDRLTVTELKAKLSGK